jgi:hypothetical protein
MVGGGAAGMLMAVHIMYGEYTKKSICLLRALTTPQEGKRGFRPAVG